jgi:hypothetical protein
LDIAALDVRGEPSGRIARRAHSVRPKHGDTTSQMIPNFF